MKLRFASLEDRIAALTNAGDSLLGLNAHINWESFRPQLNRGSVSFVLKTDLSR